MSFVAVFTALMTSFVLIAPIAMAVLLVKGPAPIRQAIPAMATAPSSPSPAASRTERHLAEAA